MLCGLQGTNEVFGGKQLGDYLVSKYRASKKKKKKDEEAWPEGKNYCK